MADSLAGQSSTEVEMITVDSVSSEAGKPSGPQDIDPEGDVIIICTDRSMRVSAKILCLTSPVFKALLTSGFREGTTQRSITSPLELKLLEDDALAMETLLKIMHFSPEYHSPECKVENTQEYYDRLKKLAMVADKYLCRNVIYRLSEQWMDTLMATSDGMQELDSLTHVAYLVRNSDRFFQLTTRMLNEKKCSELSLISSPCLKGMLQAKKFTRLEARGPLAEAVKRSIQKLEAAGKRQKTKNREDRYCTGCGTYMFNHIDAHMKCLDDASLSFESLSLWYNPGSINYAESFELAKAQSDGSYEWDSCLLSQAQKQLKFDIASLNLSAGPEVGISLQEFLDALHHNSSEW